jgi:hypothetical protein
MALVYGIYEVGSDVPVYVGHTIDDLDWRFRMHLTSGSRRYCANYDRFHRNRPHRSLLKDYWMFMHAVGVKNLEPRLIAYVRGYENGLVREREEISYHLPILNTQSDHATIRADHFSKRQAAA